MSIPSFYIPPPPLFLGNSITHMLACEQAFWRALGRRGKNGGESLHASLRIAIAAHEHPADCLACQLSHLNKSKNRTPAALFGGALRKSPESLFAGYTNYSKCMGSNSAYRDAYVTRPQTQRLVCLWCRGSMCIQNFHD